MPRYDLSGRAVLLTGSTGGLGTALARTLAARGARLALLDLDAEAVTAQARSLGAEDTAAAWRADVRDHASLTRAVNAAAAHFGGLDVAVANAGVDTMTPMATTDPVAYERVVDINLNGVWRTFRAALPHVQVRRGYLLAVSSMAAFVHSPLQAPYCASKAGVWALCDSVRLEVRHLGVGVGSAHPTFFRTPLMDDVIADPAGNALWEGNRGGMWKTVPIETVVDAIVSGIERRKDQIIAPKSLTLTAKVPGVIRPVVERLGFRPRRVERVLALATPASALDDGRTVRRG